MNTLRAGTLRDRIHIQRRMGAWMTGAHLFLIPG